MSRLKDDLITVLVGFVKNEQYEKLFRTQSFELLFRLRKKILQMGKVIKDAFLSATSDEFDKGGNHQLAIGAFTDMYSHYSLDEQISLIGKYLGSEILNDKYSTNIIDLVVAVFTEIPTELSLEKKVLVEDLKEILKEGVEKHTEESSLAVADEVKVVTVAMESNPKRFEYIEKFTAGISLDTNAWTFFAKLFKAMVNKITIKEKGALVKDYVTKIKMSDEMHGISRNRFTVVYQIITTTSIAGVDIFGMFSNLLSSESLEKQMLGADFLSFYLHSAKVSKEDNKAYKILIEKTVNGTANEDLRNKLSQLT